MAQLHIKLRKSKKEKIEDNIKKILEINPNHDVNLLEKGLIFMYDAHEGQTRLNRKKPYTDHTIAVGKHLAPEFSTIYVVSGFLHDLEKTDKTVNDIRSKFGDDGYEIADIVYYMVPLIGESNVKHNQRIIKGEIAIPVRSGDILDNVETDDVFPETKKKRRLEEAQYSFIKDAKKTQFAQTQLFKNLEYVVNYRLKGFDKATDRRYFIGKVAAGLTLLISGKKINK